MLAPPASTPPCVCDLPLIPAEITSVLEVIVPVVEIEPLTVILPFKTVSFAVMVIASFLILIFVKPSSEVSKTALDSSGDISKPLTLSGIKKPSWYLCLR